MHDVDDDDDDDDDEDCRTDFVLAEDFSNTWFSNMEKTTRHCHGTAKSRIWEEAFTRRLSSLPEVVLPGHWRNLNEASVGLVLDLSCPNLLYVWLSKLEKVPCAVLIAERIPPVHIPHWIVGIRIMVMASVNLNTHSVWQDNLGHRLGPLGRTLGALSKNW